MSLKQEIETWVKAITFYDNNEFDEALSTFEEIADTSKIHFNCGVIHATLGEHERAVQCYLEAIKLDRYLAVAYFQQGVSNFLMGDFEEALANFNDTLLYLRGNKYIDYEQLGLKFKLYSCEVLFNRGLCYIYLQQAEPGMQDLTFAAKEKAVPDHDVIDEAIRERAEGYTVFSIPVGVVYRPNEAKVKNLRSKDYLGKAKLVAAVDRNNAFTGFTGAEIKKMNNADAAKDDRPEALISFAASNLVKTDIKSRHRQQSEPPPPTRQVFPPTPPPEKDRSSGSSAGGTVPTSNTSSTLLNPSSTPSKSQAAKPPRLDLSIAGFERPKPQSPSGSSVLSRAMSDRSPRATMARVRAQSERPGARLASPGNLSRMNSERSRIGSMASSRTALSDSKSPASNYGQPPELYDEVYDMYNSRQKQQQQSSRAPSTRILPFGSQFAAPASTQGYISEEDEASSTGGFDEPDFEMMVARSATGRSSRKSRTSNSGSMVMPVLPEMSPRNGPAVEVKKIRVKVHSEDSRYVIISPSAQFPDLVASVRNKFAIMQSFKIKIRDEGDMITMSDQDDLDIALDVAKENARKQRSEMGKMEVWVQLV